MSQVLEGLGSVIDMLQKQSKEKPGRQQAQGRGKASQPAKKRAGISERQSGKRHA